MKLKIFSKVFLQTKPLALVRKGSNLYVKWFRKTICADAIVYCRNSKMVNSSVSELVVSLELAFLTEYVVFVMILKNVDVKTVKPWSNTWSEMTLLTKQSSISNVQHVIYSAMIAYHVIGHIGLLLVGTVPVPSQLIW